MRTTLKAINERLAAKGHKAHLEKGDGYFYGSEVADWLDRIVKVPTLSSLTAEQWVEEFEKLRRLNREVLKPPTGNKRQAKNGSRVAGADQFALQHLGRYSPG
jgi:hypothetical protein